MTIIFADTSAVIKRYVIEVGSDRVEGWIELEAGNVILISEMTIVEAFSALSRRRREGTLNTDAVTHLQSDFPHHVEKEYLVVTLNSNVLVQSRELVNKHPLRAMDAVQLACALQARTIADEPLTFISADYHLLESAKAEGFPIENPED